MKMLSGLVLFFAFCFPPSQAQEGQDFNPLGRDLPIEQLDLQLRIQVEWIETSHEIVTALLEDDENARLKGKLSGNAGPLRKSLRELIEEDDARILETSIVIARSGQRAKVESIAEYIYPTEYDPPNSVLQSGKESEALTTAPQAAAFETRNVGTTLEVDPIIGVDNRTIDLNLAPEIVYLLDEVNYGDFESDESNVEVTMPVFYTIKTTTQLTMIDGEYALMGVHSPFNEKTFRSDPERKVLVFVKTDILHVGLGLPEEEEKK
ncbi:MAG: hypothetical protein P1U85_15985 [Verrucomicrobiales bacterium]|jgi:Flp pilus assembly secretin CpaC|nr:hypothetical protein [Verrucomicrobiales bacterium]